MKLTPDMTLEQFDNGYWYAVEIEAFARNEVPSQPVARTTARRGCRAYGDLVRQAIVFNETKTGPLRTQQGRYNNFTSDYFAAHPHASQAEVAKAWHQVKKMNAPKTYEAWAKKHK